MSLILKVHLSITAELVLRNMGCTVSSYSRRKHILSNEVNLFNPLADLKEKRILLEEVTTGDNLFMN